jgi:hypothetical protein
VSYAALRRAACTGGRKEGGDERRCHRASKKIMGKGTDGGAIRTARAAALVERVLRCGSLEQADAWPWC